MVSQLFCDSDFRCQFLTLMAEGSGIGVETRKE
jgi:hypothetical protein